MLWNFVPGLYICYGTLFWDYIYAMELCFGTICYGTLSWDYIYAMELRSYICSLLLIFAMELCCPVMVLCCEDLSLWIKAITILCIKLFNCVLKFEIIKKSFVV